MEYPYNAFGLLLDNALALGATSILVGVEEDKGNYTIKIEDNGHYQWSDTELI